MAARRAVEFGLVEDLVPLGLHVMEVAGWFQSSTNEGVVPPDAVERLKALLAKHGFDPEHPIGVVRSVKDILRVMFVQEVR